MHHGTLRTNLRRIDFQSGAGSLTRFEGGEGSGRPLGAGRPATSYFTAPMVFSSWCFVFSIQKAPFLLFEVFRIIHGGDYRDQVNAIRP